MFQPVHREIHHRRRLDQHRRRVSDQAASALSGGQKILDQIVEIVICQPGDNRDAGVEFLDPAPDHLPVDQNGRLVAADALARNVRQMLGMVQQRHGVERRAQHQDLAARALTGARTVISIDTILNASSRRADVVLAAAGFAEKAGTTTNIEGRVNTVSQRVTPPGTARPDWMLATEIASRLGTDFGFSSPQDILDEIGSIAPAHLGLSIEVLAASPDGIVLPLDLPVDEIAD